MSFFQIQAQKLPRFASYGGKIYVIKVIIEKTYIERLIWLFAQVITPRLYIALVSLEIRFIV